MNIFGLTKKEGNYEYKYYLQTDVRKYKYKYLSHTGLGENHFPMRIEQVYKDHPKYKVTVRQLS